MSPNKIIKIKLDKPITWIDLFTPLSSMLTEDAIIASEGKDYCPHIRFLKIQISSGERTAFAYCELQARFLEKWEGARESETPVETDPRYMSRREEERLRTCCLNPYRKKCELEVKAK